jgi:hypothetical protein
MVETELFKKKSETQEIDMRVAFGFIFVIVSLMGGCASSGNQTLKTESEISVASKIVIGETSAAEIKSMFGSPYESTYTDGGLQIWKYRLDDMNADAVNFIPIVNLFGSSMSGKRKELVVLFDDEDIVKRFNMSESDVQTKSGLFK